MTSPTLKRFLSLHFFFPFILIMISFIHIILAHEFGSNNPLGIDSNDNLNLYPHYIIKDMLGFLYLIIIFIIFVCYFPDVLGHPNNYIQAKLLVTPEHIVPE